MGVTLLREGSFYFAWGGGGSVKIFFFYRILTVGSLFYGGHFTSLHRLKYNSISKTPEWNRDHKD